MMGMVSCGEGVTVGMSGLYFVAWEEVEGQMYRILNAGGTIAQAL